jgi:hypothetical protein
MVNENEQNGQENAIFKQWRLILSTIENYNSFEFAFVV